MPKSIRISSSEEEFWASRTFAVEVLLGALMLERARQPNFKRLSNRNSLMEARAQRKQMKKKE